MIRGRWHRRSRSLNVHPDAEKHRKGDLRMLQVSLTAAVVAAVKLTTTPGPAQYQLQG
jgi:hypothetical protein